MSGMSEQLVSPDTTRALAEKALDKKAALGEDIDVAAYDVSDEKHAYQEQLSDLPSEDKNRMLGVGVTMDNIGQRGGTFIQKDNSLVHSSSSQSGVEVMNIAQALETYDWLTDYWWRAVSVDADKFTANVGLAQNNGYFIRTLPGVKTVYPVQACLYLAKENLVQNVHNIIVAEEDSELHIITGCTTSTHDEPGLHLGVSEFYIKRGAKLTFTMIHSWTPGTAVRPRSGIIVEENGLFMSNYLLMKPVQSLQMNPLAKCVGDNATVRFNSILVTGEGATNIASDT